MMELANNWKTWATSAMEFPETVQFEVTNRCNSSCTMCPVPTAKRPKADLSVELVKKGIDDCVPYKKKITQILFLQNGEPLLWGVDKLVEVINYAFDKVSFARMENLGFFTNASLLTEEASEKLLDSKMNFMICSMDGGSKDVYESIRKGLSFDTVVKNITYFAKRREEKNREDMRLYVLMVPQKSNLHTLGLMMKQFAQFPNVTVCSGGLCNYAGKVDAETLAISNQYRGGDITAPCWRLYTFLIIGSNGKPLLCCNDVEQPLDLGDLRTMTMKEIWDNPEGFKKYRKMAVDGRVSEIPLCKDCDWMRGFALPDWWYKDGYDRIA